MEFIREWYTEVIMESTIDIRHVSVVIQKNSILTNITAGIQKGKITGLLGPSGAGKTTLMRAIVGMQRISSGNILVMGKEAGSSTLRHEIGYVTQAPSVYNDLTVHENLNYFASIIGRDKIPVGTIMDDVGLSPFSKRLTSTLSGGQRARLSLAVALLGEPKILVLDEPTVGQDPVLRKRLWNIFRSLTENGVTILVSSHVMDEASHCDMLLFIRDGRILAYDTPQLIMKNTNTRELGQAFLHLAEEEQS